MLRKLPAAIVCEIVQSYRIWCLQEACMSSMLRKLPAAIVCEIVQPYRIWCLQGGLHVVHVAQIAGRFCM